MLDNGEFVDEIVRIEELAKFAFGIVDSIRFDIQSDDPQHVLRHLFRIRLQYRRHRCERLDRLVDLLRIDIDLCQKLQSRFIFGILFQYPPHRIDGLSILAQMFVANLCQSYFVATSFFGDRRYFDFFLQDLRQFSVFVQRLINVFERIERLLATRNGFV